MLLSSFSIKKPYFAFIINLIIVIFGIVAYQKIPIANNPDVDLPYVWIGVSYPNASPKTEEDLILKPLEDVLKNISGVKRIEGTAKEGRANVFIEFNLETSTQKAFDDVRNAVSTLTLPQGAEVPKVIKIQMNSEPIMEISVSAPHLSVQELSSIIKDNFQPRFQRIFGVSEVNLYGDRYKEIHVNLEQNLLKTLGISPLFVENEIKSQIINKNVGQFKDNKNTFPLSVYSIPDSIETLSKLPFLTAGQSMIRLENVASVTPALTEKTSYSEYNGNPSLTISISKESQANIVQTAKEIREVVDSLNKEYKEKIFLKILQDDSKFIQHSIDSIQLDIILGSLFAVIVVLLFLHEWKNTLICMIAIPTSLIGALALIHVLHFSLNFMTLFALTLCVGIVIDDAIVVVENIHRHRVLGKTPMQAAMDGTSEIGFAAIAVTIAIISVFVPVAFMHGMIGRFFYEFGITVVAAVSISLFVAFTAVPMFSSRIKISNKKNTFNLFFTEFGSKFNIFFEKVLQFYLKILTKTLKYKKTILASALIVFILSIGLLKLVPVVFNTDTDENYVRISFQLKENTAFDISTQRGKEIEKYIKTLPGVEGVLMRIGSDSEGSNSIKYTVFLVEKNKRNFTDKEFLSFLTKGLEKFIQDPKERVNFSHRDYPLQFSFLSQKPENLQIYTAKVANYMNTLPDVSGATTSSEDPIIEFRIIPNETQLSLVNVNSSDLANTLNLLFNGSFVGKFNDGGKYIDIKMMLPYDYQNTISDLKSIFVPTQDGSQVILSSVADLSKVDVEPKIEHLNGERVIHVKANYSGKDLSNITDKVQKYINETLPIGMSSQLAGDSGELKELFLIVGSTMGFAFLFVFLVLVVQFENIVAPISIILSIPFAFSGAFLSLLLTGKSLGIVSMIGMFMLMGIVTKNAILLIEFTQNNLKSIDNVSHSLLQAAKIRFRPIIMTTLTMIAGMLPMAFSRAEGSEMSSNIAITVIGGLVSSTILTLLIIPSVYLQLRVLFHKRGKDVS